MINWLISHGPAIVALSGALGAAVLGIIGPMSPETAAVIGGVLGVFNLIERIIRSFVDSARPPGS